jgi:hypothetical protein
MDSNQRENEADEGGEQRTPWLTKQQNSKGDNRTLCGLYHRRRQEIYQY